MLVTGGTGFIGQHLIRHLTGAGAEVWAGVYPEEPPQRATTLPPRVKRVPLDVQDAESVRQAVQSAAPGVVFHLAAAGVTEPGIDPLVALDVNVRGTIHLLESLRKLPVRRVVLAGTCYEYGARETHEGIDPFNFYAASKVAAWAYGRAYWRALGLPVVVARLFQVYGPGQAAGPLVPSAIQAALTGGDLPMTPGEQQRDFIFVEDVAEGLLAAATAPHIDGESLDLGTGQPHSVRDVVDRIWALTGARGHILAGALPYRPGVAMRLIADTERTARLTGWRARVGLEEGLRRTVAEARKYDDAEIAG